MTLPRSEFGSIDGATLAGVEASVEAAGADAGWLAAVVLGLGVAPPPPEHAPTTRARAAIRAAPRESLSIVSSSASSRSGWMSTGSRAPHRSSRADMMAHGPTCEHPTLLGPRRAGIGSGVGRELAREEPPEAIRVEHGDSELFCLGQL